VLPDGRFIEAHSRAELVALAGCFVAGQDRPVYAYPERPCESRRCRPWPRGGDSATMHPIRHRLHSNVRPVACTVGARHAVPLPLIICAVSSMTLAAP